MQTEAPTKPEIAFSWSTVMFWTTVIAMCVLDMAIIRSLWFQHRLSSEGWNAYCLPFLVLKPALTGIFMRRELGNALKTDIISQSSAQRLN